MLRGQDQEHFRRTRLLKSAYDFARNGCRHFREHPAQLARLDFGTREQCDQFRDIAFRGGVVNGGFIRSVRVGVHGPETLAWWRLIRPNGQRSFGLSYDADKTDQILAELRESLGSGNYKQAIQLLRHADAAGSLRADASVVAGLTAAVGERHTLGIIKSLATDACRYCTSGRDACKECEGKGYLQRRACTDCSGLGVTRCPFCNGTALAGYDFVPRGLRAAVVAQRLDMAERRLAERNRPAGKEPPTKLARRMIEIDGCRGILANAIEQVRTHSLNAPGTTPLFTPTQRTQVEQRCRRVNEAAESLIRTLLAALGALYSDRAQRAPKEDNRRVLYAHRAKTFARLSTAPKFDGSAFATPRSLQHRPGA